MDQKERLNNALLPFIEDVENNEEYSIIRGNVDYLLSLDERKFSYDFDFAIAQANCLPISGTENNPMTGKGNENLTELHFLLYLQYKIARASIILNEYSNHCDIIGKPISKKLEETSDLYHFKMAFLELKFQKLPVHKDLHILKESIKTLGKPKKTTKATIEGKPINLLERYFLLNKLFGLEKTISTFDISKGEKDRLLGLILDCNTTNARHLMNGKYDAHLRDDALNNYLQTLKK